MDAEDGDGEVPKDALEEEKEKGKNEEQEQQEREKEEREQVNRLLEESQEKMKMKLEVRQKNQSADKNLPDESFFHKLDSSLKKNTAFVKKLGKLTEQQRDSFSNEFKSLNLSRYTQEVVSVLIDAKMKMVDIPCAVHICSLMNCRYGDFSGMLFQTWKKICQSRIEDKSIFLNIMSKLRTDLRFMSELTVAGVLTDKEGLTLVHKQLVAMTTMDKENHELLQVVISFCKHCGQDVAGLIPRKNKLLASKFGINLPRSEVFKADKQKIFYNVLLDYWKSLCDHLIKEHKELKKIDATNRSILHTKGELHEERSKKFQELQLAYHKLLVSCNSLADLLDVDMPDLPEDELTQQGGEGSVNIYDPAIRGAELLCEQSVWEDEDQMSFYTNLLDLKAIIPAILFKESVSISMKSNKKKPWRKPKNSDQKPEGPKRAAKGDNAIDQISADLSENDVTAVDQEAMAALNEANEAASTLIQEGKMELSSDDEDSDVETEADIEASVLGADEEGEEEVNMGNTMKIMMENFVSSLANCINRELIDKAAQDFCMNMNTRSNRKKLVRALFNVHRSRLDLLPFYARLVATIHPCMPDVAENLSIMLLRDYRFHMHRKDQIHIESKVKTVRFIGEMTKFGMIPTTETLNCLKSLILDFSHHAIEMCCALLEVCGRFLFRTPETHIRTRVLLEQMMRKRTVKPLEQRYSTAVDNAYYTCNPPEVEKVEVKKRPPMHEYIRKLLYKDLSKSSIEKILRQMRKLSWGDEHIRAYTIKCMVCIWNMRFNNIHCAANLVAGLTSYYDDVGVKVADDILEEIRIGMEINHPRYNQRRVSCVKYLGELYNYRIVDSTIIFNTLYSLITFAVSYDPEQPSILDPSEHLFRIRLVCSLLETCGQYFDRGISKKRLDYFLVYFQRYIWFKKSQPCWAQAEGTETEDGELPGKPPSVLLPPFPIEVEYLVQDTIEPLRSKFKLASCVSEAIKAVQELEKEVFSKLAEVVPKQKVQSLVDNTISNPIPITRTNHGLSAIPEEHNSPSPKKTSYITHTTSSQSGGSDDEWAESDSGEASLDEGESIENEPMKVADKISSQQQASMKKEEDDFDKAFENMMIESINSRKLAPVVHQDMTVPVNARKTILASQATDREDDHSVKFVLLTKRGNKQVMKPLNIPKTEQLAAKLHDREKIERQRKEELKKITLSINERQVEEEQQQALFNNRPAGSMPVNLNRERRSKYQPPKGAPNADLIFNSGGRRR